MLALERPPMKNAPLDYLPPLIGLSLLVAGCGLFELPSEAGAILFQDQFSDSNSGWDRYRDASYAAEYVDGAFQITVNQSNLEAWALPGLDFTDTIIEATAKKVDGPDDNVFGLLCRYQDAENFYFFLISSDGFAGIGIYRNGERSLLSGSAMFPADTIREGGKLNLLHAECIGDRLLLMVNGAVVQEVLDDQFQSGDVGLIAGSYEMPGVVIQFDDFIVQNPSHR
jgi:hypothetical protein